MAEISGANLINSNVVYDTRGSVGAYNAQIQKQAAQRAAEQKALNDDINKIKVDGLREADRPDYFKGFEDWRSTAQAATQEKDWKKKAELQSESDRKFLELQSFINQSKEYNKVHHEVSNKLLDDRFRNQLTDDAVNVWQQSGKLPLKDPRLVRDPSELARQVDLSAVDNKLRDVNKYLMGNARESNPIVGDPIKSGNRTGNNLIYNKVVDPKQQAYEYGKIYDTDRDIKAYIQKQYADQFDALPEDQAKTFAIKDMVSKNPLSDIRQTPVWNTAPDNFYAHYNYRLQNPLTSGDSGSKDATIYRQEQIDDIWGQKNSASGASNTVERLKAVASANPLFQGANVNTMFRDTGRWINITIPERKVAYTTTDPEGNEIQRYRKQDAYNVRIDKHNPQDKVKLNKVLDVITGEKISESKLQTGNAGGKIKGDIYTEKGKSSTSTKSNTAMVTMVLPNGQSGQIPSNKVADFLKKYPKAKKQ